ncbi:MAG: NAD(P)-dependent oxidoreductase [Acidimicrobiales bacterium]|nr:NAD(P)-dependent oxidoreductase [Acidimicrobiales bacterium]
MLTDEKILVTGPAGQIAAPLCAYLAPHNEVWGIARFSVEGSREEVEAMGVTTRVVDLADGDFSDVPDDFTYVLHLAAAIGPSTDYDHSLRVNAEATGLLLTHCRSAKAALVMSTCSVYKPNPDPRHLYTETDALGEAIVPGVPTYAVTKIAEEAVARYCARALDLPVTIARMNAAYSARGGLPAYHLDAVVAGKPVVVRNDPAPYSPIHQDDINAQVEAIVGAATVPATVVNWAGDDPVGPHDWCAEFARLSGRTAEVRVEPVPGSQPGISADNTKRLAITGPCSVRFPEGMQRLYHERYPDGPDGGIAGGMTNPLA